MFRCYHHIRAIHNINSVCTRIVLFSYWNEREYLCYKTIGFSCSNCLNTIIQLGLYLPSELVQHWNILTYTPCSDPAYWISDQNWLGTSLEVVNILCQNSIYLWILNVTCLSSAMEYGLIQRWLITWYGYIHRVSVKYTVKLSKLKLFLVHQLIVFILNVQKANTLSKVLFSNTIEIDPPLHICYVW
mgnify:FL=1